jgi:glutamate racemase
MPDTGKTILVLGGGVGGVMAARELRKRLPGNHRVEYADAISGRSLSRLSSLAVQRMVSIDRHLVVRTAMPP